MSATKRSINVLTRAADMTRVRQRCDKLEAKCNALRDALRWATAGLVIADEEFIRPNGQGTTPKSVSKALYDSKACLHRISSHRINSKPSTVFATPS